ncbi:hypothetical protein VPH35_016808 [Triticum aestivum]|uniref:non-specific serine/threonine protein kinase n=1 Tax=Triticum aestivum TaxID=4565 RepID=A0A3B6A0N3_WHEAT|nr:LEAF RUST 10 DISEASE-RESISTANCE LOCUS RECEPTOR-LIKE PROTEIN KINASE-like 1.2 isoform X1 [Triticum aestivum]
MPLLLLLLRVLLLAAGLAVSRGYPTAGAGEGSLYNSSMCQKSFACGGINIHYPFYLSSESKVVDGVAYSYCGYPGMAVLCDDSRANATATLRLAGGTNYTVHAIDYDNHTITLADADVINGVCPMVRHNVNIPREAWLNFTPTGNSTISFFLDCSFTTNVTVAPLPPPELVPINCTGFERGRGSSFLATQLGAPDGNWTRACKEVYVAPVLTGEWLTSPDSRGRLGSGGYGDVLRRGFRLSWDPSAGPCFKCELSGGRCSYDQPGGFLGCLCSDGRVRNMDCGPKRTSKNAIIAVGCSAAALVLFVLLLVVSFLYIRKRRQYKMTSSSRLLKYSNSGGTPRSRGGSDLESSGVHNLQTHHFAYEELEEATGGFSDTRELGDGGFGTVYKGQLRDGRVVAVKRLYNNGCRHVEQFLNEAAILSRLRHPNLVTFYGCTSSRSRELLLVYEYVPNGTVADHLQGHRAAERALPWPLRLNVAVEAAAALAYLHAIDPPVVHRDVKTTNILLDADFHVKVADFGLSRLFPLDGATHVSTAPQGTPGYVDPEYHQCYQLTDRSDVYSFGVVLAELISSKPAVDVTRDRDEINLAAMAVGRIQRSELDQLVDAELGYGSDEATTRAITMVAELAFRCLQQNSEMRPPIKEVLDGLRGIQQGGAKEKKYDVIVVPRSPNTVHAPWDSMSTTPSISQ